MRTIILQREHSSDVGTFGHAHADDALLEFVTLELPWRDLNHDGLGDPQKSCITPGEYTCVWHQSPSKGWVYHVQNVVGRSHILIHAANWAGDVDKGWHSDLLGCIAPGTLRTNFENPEGKVQEGIANSKLALRHLHEWGASEPFVLKILPP